MSERVDCPACHSSNCVPVRRAADIVKCDECALVYLRTRPSVVELEQHYQNYADNPGSHMKLPETVDAAKRSGLRRDYFLQEVIQIIQTNERGSMLDIGCGWGAFLDNARDKRFGPVGIEICKRMAEYAVGQLQLVVFQKQLETCPLPDKSFQVVTAIHSLEHLPSQQTALQTIHRVLEPGGWFCGIVPNYNSYCSMVMRDSWPWLDPTMHYVHFTPDTLSFTLSRFGFRLVKWYTKTGDFAPSIIEQELKLQSSTKTIEELEHEDLGEELRFFAQKI